MTAVTPPASVPVLSLCIPTYKRAALLEGALRAVLGQITPALTAQVEVLILDNASPDETPGVVQKAQEDFGHVPLRYVRRPENIGPDANFTDALTQARGEFLYLLSDDDVLLPGAVETLLRLIAAHPGFDAFGLNTRPFTHSPDEKTEGIFRLERDVTLGTRDEALAFLNTHITFLSCIAFRRANVLEKNYADKTGTVLIQAFFFVDALAPGRGFHVTRQPYLAQRADNNQGFNFFEIFVTNFDLVLRYARQNGYSEAAIGQVRAKVLRFVCYVIGVFKTKGAIGTIRPDYRDGMARLWRVYGPHPVLLLVIVPMILTPRAIYDLLFTRLYALYRRGKAGRIRAGRGEAAS